VIDLRQDPASRHRSPAIPDRRAWQSVMRRTRQGDTGTAHHHVRNRSSCRRLLRLSDSRYVFVTVWALLNNSNQLIHGEIRNANDEVCRRSRQWEDLGPMLRDVMVGPDDASPSVDAKGRVFNIHHRA
jgi:hypothetical protein